VTHIIDDVEFEQKDWHEYFQKPLGLSFGDERVLSFLNLLSSEIMRTSAARNFSDLITFADFCRGRNLKLEVKRRDNQQRCGVGNVIHIAPANIPINFAFTMVMGLLSGNRNIVRVPSDYAPQVELFLQIWGRVVSRFDDLELRDLVAFVSTSRNSVALRTAITICDALVVWGGDATVEYFRSFKRKPLSVDLFFPNRRSCAVFSADALLDLESVELTDFCRRFFNDTYLVDQNACSSPSLIYWVGSDKEIIRAQKKFWPQLERYLHEHSDMTPFNLLERHVDLMSNLETMERGVELKRDGGFIWRFTDSGLMSGVLRLGVFVEHTTSDVKDLFLNGRDIEQTVTIFGVDPNDIHKSAKLNDTRVDRVVSVGNALDIGFVWDGKDTLQQLSRVISFA
jgi:hypothetical protein